MPSTDPVDALFERARENRVPMSLICERAGVAATTPSRWKHGKNGATVEAVNKLNAALSDIIDNSRAA